jgi:flagellum-specific peptidoglycan hydrolase FlgJ
VCYIHDIKFPDIVYAQARLESGNFKSKLFQTKNNFLGLYNSRINDFYEFEHWTDCLIGYKDLLQFKYKGDNNRETYFTFLKELPYAMDPNYITKIRNMAEN